MSIEDKIDTLERQNMGLFLQKKQLRKRQEVLISTVDKLEAENQQLREVLEQIDNMAISPEWRNEPLWRIAELTEAALQEDTYHSKDWKDQMIQDQGLEE